MYIFVYFTKLRRKKSVFSVLAKLFVVPSQQCGEKKQHTSKMFFFSPLRNTNPPPLNQEDMLQLEQFTPPRHNSFASSNAVTFRTATHKRSKSAGTNNEEELSTMQKWNDLLRTSSKQELPASSNIKRTRRISSTEVSRTASIFSKQQQASSFSPPTGFEDLRDDSPALIMALRNHKVQQTVKRLSKRVCKHEPHVQIQNALSTAAATSVDNEQETANVAEDEEVVDVQLQFSKLSEQDVTEWDTQQQNQQGLLSFAFVNHV